MDTPRDLNQLLDTDDNDTRPRWRHAVDTAGGWVRRNGPATVVVAAGLTLACLVLWLIWLALCAIGRGIAAGAHGVNHGVGWAAEHAINWGGQLWTWASGPLAHTISDPIHHYLHTHTDGLPMSGGQAFTLWVVTLCVTWGLATLRESGAARIGWILAGALTVAGVYAGTTGDAKATAAAVTVTAWGLASLTVFTGSWRRLTLVNVYNTITKTNDDE